MGEILLKLYIIIIISSTFFLQLNTSLATTSSIKNKCPSDSIESSDDHKECKCNPDLCKKPPCLSNLKIIVNGSDIPGKCCPSYSCEGCNNNTLLHGQCPCAENAILNAENKCKCIDPEKTLKDGKCICDESLCKLPKLCDNNSVLIYIDTQNNCCPKSQCKQCPDDSFSSNYNSDDIEDKCICFPCKSHCETNNQTTKIIQKGKGIPGSCCDMYICEDNNNNNNGIKNCIVGDKIYNEGDTWKNWQSSQICQCRNGISLCYSDNNNYYFHYCQVDENIYKNGESWMQDNCTNCTCLNGEQKCIAHFCHTDQSQIKLTNNNCPSLINCYKNCTYGLKINKYGCKICKCNSLLFIKSSQDDILQKYNLTKDDLIEILEERLKLTSSSTTTHQSTTIKKQFKIDKNNITNFVISTKNCNNDESMIIKGIYAFVTIFVITLIIGSIVIYKSYKRKGSYDPVKLKGADNYIITA